MPRPLALIILVFIRVHSWWESIVQRFPKGPRELNQPTAPSIPLAQNPDPSNRPIIATFLPREVFRGSAELLHDSWSCSEDLWNSSRNAGAVPRICGTPPGSREVFRGSVELLQDPWSCSDDLWNSSRNLAKAPTALGTPPESRELFRGSVELLQESR